MSDDFVEAYTVTIYRNKNTGLPVSETWKSEHGQEHREDGPAVRSWDRHTGRLTMERFCKHGKGHRSDGPSSVRYDATTGEICSEIWSVNGQIHRQGGMPASWRKEVETGIISEEQYFENDALHRIGAPAKIERDYETGEVIFEEWAINGQTHRPDGLPAILQIDAGNRYEQYWEHGVNHRLGAPAIIETDEATGKVYLEHWYVEGQKHRPGGLPALWEKNIKTGVTVLEEYWENGARHRTEGPAVIKRDRQSGKILAVR